LVVIYVLVLFAVVIVGAVLLDVVVISIVLVLDNWIWHILVGYIDFDSRSRIS
jgi:hypothetical protein